MRKILLISAAMLLSMMTYAQDTEAITSPTIALKSDAKNVVTITVGTTSSTTETVTTYYTTDDSEPSASNGTAITENTNITLGYSGFRVKAIAISTSGSQSDVASFDFCYRGPWEEFEIDGNKHVQGLVKYKKTKDGEVYIIPAWDRRLEATSSGNGFVRVQRKPDGTGKIVTAMGVWYKEDGSYSFNGQFQTSGLYVWNEINNSWLYVTDLGTLQYNQIFNTGEGASESYVFKDSSSGSVNVNMQVGRKNTDYTVPADVQWLSTDPYLPSQTKTINEIGIYAYGNATYSTATYNRSIIKKLTIQTNIQKIGFSAFRGINTLQEVVIEDGGTLTAIPERCFDACWNLKTVEFPSTITSIGGAAFGGCGALNKIIFKSVTPPTLGKYNDTQDVFTTPLSNYSHSNVNHAQCTISVPLVSADSYAAVSLIRTFNLSSPIAFPESKIATCCATLPFTVSDGMEAFYVQQAGIYQSYVSLTAINSNEILRDGDGLILIGTTGTEEIIYPNDDDPDTFTPQGNKLVGVTKATTVNIDEDFLYFVLSTNGEFIPVKTSGTLPANKAYLKVGSDWVTPLNSLAVTLPEETGIVSHEAQKVQDNVYYTLQGTQISQPQKGLVIKNGKKYIVK